VLGLADDDPRPVRGLLDVDPEDRDLVAELVTFSRGRVDGGLEAIVAGGDQRGGRGARLREALGGLRDPTETSQGASQEERRIRLSTSAYERESFPSASSNLPASSAVEPSWKSRAAAACASSALVSCGSWPCAGNAGASASAMTATAAPRRLTLKDATPSTSPWAR
jgi:hypothetical protein